MYLTEMHCHTSEGSDCARESARDTVDKYVEAGYTSLVLTNHYSPATMFFFDRTKDYTEFTKRYLDAYYMMRDYAEGKLNVLLGAEVRFIGIDRNDYLVYGLTEEFLYSHLTALESELYAFAEEVHKNGMLIFQAHPFRKGMNISNSKHLDGYEVFNGSVTHDSHNDLANTWADYYDKLKSAGTDHHNPEDMPDAGIYTAEPIVTNDDLLRVLRSNDYLLHRSELPNMTRSN